MTLVFHHFFVNNMNGVSTIRNGTIGGTLTIVLANIHAGDLLKTVVLSVVGAIISFGTSLLMKRLTRGKKSSSR
jgi:hypothetical protein